MEKNINPIQSQGNEETVVSNVPVNQNEKKDGKLSWKAVMIGGVPGLVLGSAGAALASELSRSTENAIENQNEDNTNDDGIRLPDDVTVASSVSDDMSFSEAFAAARAEVGPGGVFSWHGNLYNTYTQEEWVSRNPVNREPIIEEPKDEEQDVPKDDDSKEDPKDDDSGNQDEIKEPVPEPEPEPEPEFRTDIIEGSQVEVLDSGSYMDDYGNTINYVDAKVDGHDAAFVDLNNDGFIDKVGVDLNDNGNIDEGEVIDTSNSDLHITDLVDPAEAGISTIEDDIYADNPDYTNDADASPFV